MRKEKTMKDDSGRCYLVTTFICSECNHKLEMSIDTPKSSEYNGKDDGITGAYKLNNRIKIHPCKVCKKEYSQAANILKEICKYSEVKGESSEH